MPRKTKKQKAQDLLSEGRSIADVAKATGLYQDKVAKIRDSMADSGDITMDSLKVDINEKIEAPKSKPAKAAPVVYDIGSGFGEQSGQQSAQQVNQAELDKFRGYLASHVSKFEGALFKAVTEKPMPKEEQEMLEEAWLGMFRCVIKDTNVQLAVASILLITAHGTVYMMNKDEIGRGIKRMRTRKQIPSQASGEVRNDGKMAPTPKKDASSSSPSVVTQSILKGDRLVKDN